MQPNRTVVAVTQLAVFAFAIAALVVMTVLGRLPTAAVSGMFGVVLGHVGVIAYNGATSAARPTSAPTPLTVLQPIYAQQPQTPPAPAPVPAPAPAGTQAQAPAPAETEASAEVPPRAAGAP